MSFRIEEKLKVDPTRLPVFLNWLAESGASLLYPPRRVVSVYLDNDQLSMFHDSREGVLPRKKLRFRRYESRCELMTGWNLESKISAVEGRFKTSVPVTGSPYDLHGGLVDDHYGLCRQRVEVAYVRNYFALDGIRVTVDQDITYRRVVARFQSTPVTSDPDIAIELKAPHELPVDKLNSLFPWDRMRFSKYCRAVEATLLHGDQRSA